MRFAPFFGILSQNRVRGKGQRGKLKEERGKWGIFEGAGVNGRRGEAPRPTECNKECSKRADVGTGPYGGFYRVQGYIGWNYRVRLGMIWVEMKIWGLCFLYFYIIMKC